MKYSLLILLVCFINCSTPLTKIQEEYNNIIKADGCDMNKSKRLVDSLFKKRIVDFNKYVRFPISESDSTFSIVYSLKKDSIAITLSYYFLVNKSDCKVEVYGQKCKGTGGD